MNTTEDNKLIAEFIQKGSEGFGLYDFKGCHYKLNKLEFHSSWDWLMPVVGKITQDEKFWEVDGREYLMDIVPYARIEDVYDAVVLFIKWYNETIHVEQQRAIARRFCDEIDKNK